MEHVRAAWRIVIRLYNDEFFKAVPAAVADPHRRRRALSRRHVHRRRHCRRVESQSQFYIHIPRPAPCQSRTISLLSGAMRAPRLEMSAISFSTSGSPPRFQPLPCRSLHHLLRRSHAPRPETERKSEWRLVAEALANGHAGEVAAREPPRVDLFRRALPQRRGEGAAAPTHSLTSSWSQWSAETVRRLAAQANSRLARCQWRARVAC